MPAGRQTVNNSKDELRVLQDRLLTLVQQIEALNQDSHHVDKEISYVFVSLLVIGSVSLLGGL